MAEENLESVMNKNNELVKAVQYWKMMAAQREDEILLLKKEVTDLRSKLSRLQTAEADCARKLNTAIQSASEEALSQLVQTSGVVAKMLELVKTFMFERQQIEPTLPRWSCLGKSPAKPGKVHKVRPMMGGTHLQPVVALRRNEPILNRSPSNMMQDTQRSRSAPIHVLQDANEQNMSIPTRAVPMHMLQVYVPLTRIDDRRPADAQHPSGSGEPGAGAEENEDDNEVIADSSSDASSADMDGSEQEDADEGVQGLEIVTEEMELEEEAPQSSHMGEGPRAGPSWRLDVPTVAVDTASENNSEPHSANMHNDEPIPGPSRQNLQVEVPDASAFTPTVRRRKRVVAPSPRLSPRPSPLSPHISPCPARRMSKDRRILKVLVSKLRLDDDGNCDNVSPPKRRNVTELPPRRTKPTAGPKRSNSTETHQTLNQNHSQDSPVRFLSPMRQSVEQSPIFHLRDQTSSQRIMRFDAPSPNGSTDSRVLVFNTRTDHPEPCCSGISRARTLSRTNSRDNLKNHSNHANHSSNHDNPQASATHNQSNKDNHRTTSQPNNSHNDNHHDTPTGQTNHSNNDHHSIRTNHPDQSKDNQRTSAAKQNHQSTNHNDHTKNSNHHPLRPNVSSTDDPKPSTSFNRDSYIYVNDSRNSQRRRLNSHNDNHTSRNDVDSDSSNSDAVSETRTRRARKAVIYKEKPLNRKMRR